MAQIFDYLLLGGGLTSASAAKAIRERDSDASVAIVGSEVYLPYDRPPLSKNLLTDPSLTVEDIASVADDFYASKDVVVFTGQTAVSIDRSAQTVRCSGGEQYGYGKLLIATGSSPRPLIVQGRPVESALLLRSFDDSVRLRSALDGAKSAVLIGAGYIGMEIAAACVAKSVRATVIDTKPHPWSKFAGATLGGFLVRHFEGLGIDFALAQTIESVETGPANSVVHTSDALRLEADVLLAGIGVDYNTGIAKDCGLEVDEKGRIAVDATLKTQDPSIWAAGDIAAYFDLRMGAPFNAEHYMNAKWQGETVGRNMAGAAEPYDRVPYFFSDMGPLHMVLRGKSENTGKTLIFGDMDAEEFVEIYPGSDGSVEMAVAMGSDDKRLDNLSNRFETLILNRTKTQDLNDAMFA